MTRSKRNRSWIWYFVILGALTVTAITVMIVFNLKQQLKPEQLAAARALWAEKKPADYDMEYTKAVGQTETYAVKVRGGKTVSVTLDGRDLGPDRYAYYDMDGLLASIDGFLEHDAKPNQPRTFTKATFSANDGHVIRFIRRVLGTNERLEINVKLQPVEKSNRGLADRPPSGDNRP